MLNREKMEVKNDFFLQFAHLCWKDGARVYIYVKFDNKSIDRSRFLKEFRKTPQKRLYC